MLTRMQWEKLSAELRRVGGIHDPHDFIAATLVALHSLVFYDQGRVYYLDEQSHVQDEFLVNVDKQVTRDYHELYSKTDGGAYSVENRIRTYRMRLLTQKINRYEPQFVDLNTYPHESRFWREYVRPLGIRYSAGISICDNRDRLRATFMLDRLPASGNYTQSDFEVLTIATEHLDNLFRNFFVKPPDDRVNAIALETSDLNLSNRENTVAALLLRGNSPKSIAKTLGISTATVYKHVSNMHRKLGVSNQAELISVLSKAASHLEDDVFEPVELPFDEISEKAQGITV